MLYDFYDHRNDTERRMSDTHCQPGVPFLNKTKKRLITEESMSETRRGAVKAPKKKEKENKGRQENIILAAINEIKDGLFDGVVIFLSDKMENKDVMTGIALKHFFEDLHIPAQILSNKFHARRRCVDPVLAASIDEDREIERFIAISLSAKAEYQIVGDEYKKTYILFNTAIGKGVNRFAVKNLSSPTGQCIVELLFPAMLDAMTERGLGKISGRTLTDLYVAMLYATSGYERKVCVSALDTMKNLIKEGADYREAYVRYDMMPTESLECARLLTSSLSITNRIATCMISNSSLPENSSRNAWEKAVRAFRNLDGADAWVVYIEEEPGTFYTILQAKGSSGYDVSKVAKKNNGTGDERFCRCIIYAMDIQKVMKDTREMIEATRRK